MPTPQSVLFSKLESPATVNRGRGWTIPSATRWLTANGFIAGKVFDGPEFWRFRQVNPNEISPESFRTDVIRPRGVQVIEGELASG